MSPSSIRRNHFLSQGLCACGGSPTAGRKSCAECQARVKRRNDRRRQDPSFLEYERSKGQVAYARRKKEALQVYGTACQCCGESRFEFLTFDHINGVGAVPGSDNRSGAGLVRWLKKNGFPPGFRTLCMNCNTSIGHYGYCPHSHPSRFDLISLESGRGKGRRTSVKSTPRT